MTVQTLAQAAIWVNPASDNVAVAKYLLPAGLTIWIDSLSVTLTSEIPAGHRFAIFPIPEGADVRQYGQPFALSRGIQAGEPVNEKNTTNLSEERSRQIPRQSFPLAPWQGTFPTFQGFLRPDGLAGTRNWVAVIPTSMCSSHEARLIAETAERSGIYRREKWKHVDGVTVIPHPFGCGCMDYNPDEPSPRLGELATTLSMLNAMIRHPNVGAVLLIELGCEKTNLKALTEWMTGQPTTAEALAAALHKPAEFISIQQAGGTKAAVQAGLAAVERLLAAANLNQRQSLPLEKLALGLKCGGSDAFSGITANPALGEASDLLIRAGGRSLISEIPEFFGAEHLFASRAINAAVEKEIFAAIARFRAYLQSAGGHFEDNPSPGNRTGGLLNITIKALGAVAKSGQAPVSGVLDYLESVWQQPRGGLYLLYAPGYDQVSTPALVASGAQIVCFTTGRGTGIGNAIAPVIKIASNSELMVRMGADMDIDAGKMLNGEATVQTLGSEIFQKIIQVASGEPVKAEETGHREFAIWSEEKVTL